MTAADVTPTDPGAPDGGVGLREALAAAVARIEESKASHQAWADHLASCAHCEKHGPPPYIQTRDEHLRIVAEYDVVLSVLADREEHARRAREEALAPVLALHQRRRHTANGGVARHRTFDFVAHGQTEFPDLCADCETPWPCSTRAALASPPAAHDTTEPMEER